MFNKLYGKEREIVLEIHDKDDEDAAKLLQERYDGLLSIKYELESLEKMVISISNGMKMVIAS